MHRYPFSFFFLFAALSFFFSLFCLIFTTDALIHPRPPFHFSSSPLHYYSHLRLSAVSILPSFSVLHVSHGLCLCPSLSLSDCTLTWCRCCLFILLLSTIPPLSSFLSIPLLDPLLSTLVCLLFLLGSNERLLDLSTSLTDAVCPARPRPAVSKDNTP